MQDIPGADIPQQKFKIAVLRVMESRSIDPETLSEVTKIPVGRIEAIMGRKPGAALFSDLVALAIFFNVSIDSFFS